MCGRFAQAQTREEYLAYLADEAERDIAYDPEPIGRYNVAPGIPDERFQSHHRLHHHWLYAPARRSGSQFNAIAGHFFFQRFQAFFEVLKVVAQPDGMDITTGDKNVLFAQFGADHGPGTQRHNQQQLAQLPHRYGS